MKFYLSSYKLGDKADQLKEMIGNRRIALIPNAIDFLDAEKINYAHHLPLLESADIDAEVLDLKDYFGKEKELSEKLKFYGGVMVSGGNAYVLREAMHLSGFENILSTLPDDFVYSAWSAGICVLAPRLEGLHHVDDPTKNPYNTEVIMTGLGVLDYLILPHYKSDHPESVAIDKDVEYCKEHNIKYKTLSDGEVIILEQSFKQ